MLCNGQESQNFGVDGGVRQRCPLAPYLFLFIGEVLNIAANQLLEDRALSGIKIPDSDEQQLIIQYADDTSLTLQESEENLRMATSFLERFKHASGLSLKALHIGCPTLTAYLVAGPAMPLDAGEISVKAARDPFGLNPSVSDVDAFHFQKVSKKFDFWQSVQHSLTGRAIIVNSELLSTLWYIVAIWGAL